MSRFERWSVWLTTALTAGTGIGYFWTKYLVETSDPFAVINHPLQPFFLKAHILVSPLLLLALGMISLRHVWQHFRSGVRWSRRSGITTALSVLPMVVTGYLIQVLTSTGWVRAMAISHIAFGTLYLVGIGLHRLFIRRGAAPGPRNGRRARAGIPRGIRPGRSDGRRAERAAPSRRPPTPGVPVGAADGKADPSGGREGRGERPEAARVRRTPGSEMSNLGTDRETDASWP